MAFNGSGAIKAWLTSNTSGQNVKSFGISSVSDIASARLGVTLSTASSNTKYSIFCNYSLNDNVNPNFVLYNNASGTKSSTTFELKSNTPNGGTSDSAVDYFVLVVDTF